MFATPRGHVGKERRAAALKSGAKVRCGFTRLAAGDQKRKAAPPMNSGRNDVALRHALSPICGQPEGNPAIGVLESVLLDKSPTDEVIEHLRRKFDR
jgi:hypothetical protein